MPRTTCPKCGAVLDLTDDMVGQQIECGACQAVFVARSDAPRSSRRGADDDRPSRRRDDDRPSRRRDDDEGDRPSRRRRDDEDDDRPSRKGRRDDEESPRPNGSLYGLGVASLVLGVLAILIEVPSFATSLFGAACCFCFGIASWLGHAVGAVFAVVGLGLGIFGLKDPKGKGMALTGTVLSGITLLGAVIGIVLSLLGIAVFAANVPPRQNQQLNNPPPFGQPAPNFKRPGQR